MNNPEEVPEKDNDNIEDNEDEMNALVDLLEDFGNQQMKAEADQFNKDQSETQLESDPERESNAEIENGQENQLFESEDPEDDQHGTELEEKFQKPVPPPRPSFKN